MSISSADTGFATGSGSVREGMPDPAGSLHIATLDYYCTFSTLTDVTGKSSFSVPDPVRFSFGFETGSTTDTDGSVIVSWDYSWFDQVTVEADIAFAMSQIVAAVAELLGLAIGVVSAAVLIRRIWTWAPNVQGTASGSGRVVTTDVMVYPPHAVVDRLRRAVETGRIEVQVMSADSGRSADAAYSFGGDWVHATEGASQAG